MKARRVFFIKMRCFEITKVTLAFVNETLRILYARISVKLEMISVTYN
jgi:hypothetical protein